MSDLFDIENTLSFNKDKLVVGNEYDYVTRTSSNQGVFQGTGFVNKENLNSENVWSLGLLQMDFFYRKKQWYAGQFIRKIIPKFETTERNIIFFTAMLNRLKPILLQVLVRNVDETFKNQNVSLPYKNGEIDFDFMETFIEELEAERIADLSVYLKVSELDDYKLTGEEEQSLNRFQTLEWELYKIGDLFEKLSTKKLPYKAKDLPDTLTGNYVLPCLTSSFKNQGLNYYVPKENATILKNVISIPSNSDVYKAYYQPREFTVLSDAYAIDWKFDKAELTKYQYLFMVMCINKVTDLPRYSYKMKLGGWNVVKNIDIALPVQNGKIDLSFMNAFINAISKSTIQDVVKYVDKKTDVPKPTIQK
ncbi:type I restriction endonuclease subunit R [Listeria seeligeri]|nr:type I restriction endonuclease subunit R [Listeria seeligeri]